MANAAVVEYKGDQLIIDASLLTDFQFRVDSLYEFIGEIQASYGGRRRKNGGSGKKKTKPKGARVGVLRGGGRGEEQAATNAIMCWQVVGIIIFLRRLFGTSVSCLPDQQSNKGIITSESRRPCL